MARKKEITKTVKAKTPRIKVAARIHIPLSLCVTEALDKKINGDVRKLKIKRSEVVRRILEANYSRKSA